MSSIFPFRIAGLLRCSTYRLTVGSVRLYTSSSNAAAEISPDYFKGKPISAIPGPKGLPFIGNLHQLWKEGNKPGHQNWLVRMSREYGPVTKFRMAGETVVLVSDPSGIEKAFRNEGQWPSRGTVVTENVKWINDKNKISEGVISASGADWKRLRSAMSKQVVPRRLANYTSGLCSVSNDLCNHFASQRDANGWMNDIFDAMGKWSLKGVSYVVFDEQINVFSGEDARGALFIKASQDFIESLAMITQALPIYKVFPTKPYKFYVSSLQNIRKLGRDLMKHRHDQLSEACQQGTLGETSTVGLLEQWLLEGKLTEEEAISQACDQLAAGVDTTSNTGTFLLHELAKQPDLQVEVRQEIMDVLGSTSQPSFDQLQKMKLVRACVREILRLYPATPVTFREVASDANISGYNIPAGTLVFVNIFSPSRDSRYFTSPDQFVPSRWLEEKEKSHPFSSLPFGFGPRMCYGRRIAELELYLLLVQVLRRFNLSTDQTEIKKIQKTALRPDEPVHMRFTDN